MAPDASWQTGSAQNKLTLGVSLASHSHPERSCRRAPAPWAALLTCPACLPRLLNPDRA